MKTLVLIGLLALTLAAQNPQTPQTPPDNSKVNQRDQTSKAPTADDQGTSKADIDRTAAVRKAVNDQTGLSTYAKNVKIITRDGLVTLRGPVRDQDERTRIAKIATDIAGEKQVKNELEIAPKQ